MKPFEYFDHTADTLFRAYGKDFSEALKNVVLATYNSIVDIKTVKPMITKKITVRSKTKESLVYDVINELLFFIDTEAFLGCEVARIKVDEEGDVLTAEITIKGDSASNQYDIFSQIKSATYNEMEIGRTKDNVFIQAVLDL